MSDKSTLFKNTATKTLTVCIFIAIAAAVFYLYGISLCPYLSVLTPDPSHHYKIQCYTAGHDIIPAYINSTNGFIYDWGMTILLLAGLGWAVYRKARKK